MKTLIDFSLFQYKWIEINQDNETFTYKTDENTAKKINHELFDTFKKLNASENILNDLFGKRNNHEVREAKQRDIILKIFKSFGFKDEYIDEYIGSNSIYQTKTKGERRLFYIIETLKLPKNDKTIILKPLFLDINHVIYNNEHFPKKFQVCVVCLEKECHEQINQIY